MKNRIWVCAALFVAMCGSAMANVIWLEDFSDVSDWTVGYDPGAGSSITSDGSVGSLYVNAAANQAAFIPVTGVAPFVPFDPFNSAQYAMQFTVVDLTGSTSYDIALDEFDASHGYVGTVWQVYPTANTSIDVGTYLVNLGAYSFDSSAQYLMPKLTVHTGFGEQTVRFDELQFTQTSTQPAPDPASTAGMTAVALAALFAARKRS